MVILRRWSQLPSLMNIRWDCHTKLTALIAPSTKESTLTLPPWRLGTIYTPTATTSTQTGELHTANTMAQKNSTLFSNGLCMILSTFGQMESLSLKLKQSLLTQQNMNSMVQTIASAEERFISIDSSDTSSKQTGFRLIL
jgi:hypothetical protein